MEQPPLTPFRAVITANRPLVWTKINTMYLAIYERVIVHTIDQIVLTVVGYHPGKRFALENMFRHNNAYSKIDNHESDYLSLVLVNTTYPEVIIDLTEPDSLDRLDELWTNPPCNQPRDTKWPHAPLSTS